MSLFPPDKRGYWRSVVSVYITNKRVYACVSLVLKKDDLLLVDVHSLPRLINRCNILEPIKLSKQCTSIFLPMNAYYQVIRLDQAALGAMNFLNMKSIYVYLRYVNSLTVARCRTAAARFGGHQRLLRILPRGGVPRANGQGSYSPDARIGLCFIDSKL